MTTQTLDRNQTPSAAVRTPSKAFAPQLAGLMAVPGFLQISVSNALAHSFGQRMQGIAVAWLVLEMTGSKFWLGVVNGAPAISIVLFSLVGGVLADSRDARRLLVATRLGLAASTVLTALLAATGTIGLTYLVVYVLLIVGVAAIDMPVSRNHILATVGSPRLLAANSMQSVFMNLVNIVTPLTIGVLIGLGGSSAAFWLLGAGYSVGALLILRTRSLATTGEARQSIALGDVVAGLAYIRRTPCVAALLGLAFLVPVAGVYFAMVPVYAREVLAIGPTGLGMLVASFSVGSLLGSLYLAVNGSIRRRGFRLTVLGIVFGCGMMAFAVSENFVLSCGISFIMGLCAGFWQNMLGAMVQLVAAPEMRGRVVSVFTMAFQMMGIGWLAAGFAASAFGNVATLLVAGSAFTLLSGAVYVLSEDTRSID